MSNQNNQEKSPLGKDLKNKDIRYIKKKRSLGGVLFSSFFGAFLIAGSFAYFNYKFSEFQFINFSEWTLYTKKDIFTPKEERYLVIIYSSRDKLSIKKLQQIKSETPILLIDFYQDLNSIFQLDSNNYQFLRSGTNTFLKIVQRFDIYETPTLFFIKKTDENIYKQDSTIQTLEDFEF